MAEASQGAMNDFVLRMGLNLLVVLVILCALGLPFWILAIKYGPL